jgi:hypothetical protein
MEKVKVFIAHSTHGGDDNSVYDKLAKNYQNSDLLEVINVDNSNQSLVLKKITDNIDECDLFVCDLTSEIPIDDNNKYSLVNSNVMFEIGYAHAKNKECIYIINEDKNGLNIPSMLYGLSLVTYGNDYNISDVIDAIDNKCKETKDNNDWRTIDVNLSDEFTYYIYDLLDIECDVNFVVRASKKIKQICILIIPINKKTLLQQKRTYMRKINVCTRKLHLMGKEIDLSKHGCINNELKHIETLVNFEWLKV